MPGTEITVWSRDDGMPFPNFNDEPDLDDFCPEGNATKQFWKNKYTGINQWHKESKYE